MASIMRKTDTMDRQTNLLIVQCKMLSRYWMQPK